MSEIDATIDELADLEAIAEQMLRRRQPILQRIRDLKWERVKEGKVQRLVTDHALLRYLERHMGIDISAIRDTLRTLAQEAIPAKDGEHHWHEKSAVMLIIGDEGQVITVLTPEQVAKNWSGRKLKNGMRVDGISAETQAALDAIDANIRAAAQMGHLIVGGQSS